MERKIKFNDEYPKLWGQRKGKLLTVEMCDSSALSEKLLDYDCRRSDNTFYEIQEGLVIQLIFEGDEGIPFKTIRKYNHTKLNFYLDNVGEDFELVRVD